MTDLSSRSTSPQPNGLDRAFPLADLLESLEGLLDGPVGSQARRVEEALRSLLAVAGAAGAYLVIDAPPLPSVALGGRQPG